MLEFIRSRAQGWLAWAIVIIIIVPFALWGINQYFGGGQAAPAAEVNGAPISQGELQRAYYNERQRLQDLLGRNFDPDMFPEERLRQQALERMIRQELLVQTAVESGLRVSDAQLGSAIRQIDAFVKDGKFDAERYRQLLAQQGMQPAFFESSMRRDLLSEQLYRGFTESVVVTEDQVDDYLRLRNQTRDIGYLTLALDRFVDEVEVSDEEIEAFYQENAERFRVPERVKAAYLELSVAQIADSIEVGEEALQARYEAQKANYRTPEERRARHILIAVPGDAPDDEERAAEAKAQELLGRIRQGAEFAELAKEYSDDPGSAAEGGDLGFFGREVMDPAFEEAVFSTAPGDLAGPVRSAFGYHIIKVEEVRGGKVKPFADVRDQILRDVRRERAEEQFYDKEERLANLTYEHPDTLSLAAEQLGLEIKETEPFPRTGAKSGIAANPEFAGAAFSDDVLTGGNNSEIIELDSNHVVVLRVREHLPAEQRPLTEVKESISEELKRRKAAELATERATGIAGEIARGGEPEAIAESAGAEWQRVEALRRDDAQVAPAITAKAFGMARPEGDGPRVEPVVLRSGARAVVALFGVEPGNVDGDEERKAARRLLRSANAEAVFSGVMDAIRARSEVKIRQ